MNRERAVKFVSGLKSPRVTAFRNCFEAGMDYETALGSAGLLDQPALRIYWDHLELMNNS